MSKTDHNDGPIFVVGMNGSGTTALLDHLNSHSKIYGFLDETRILPYYLQNSHRFGDLAIPNNGLRLWKEMCNSFPFWKANNETAIPIPDDWTSLGTSPAVIFDYILTYFAKYAGKSIWCEKSPMYALHIEKLSQTMPHARFIHIIRDGRDCSASFQRRWGYNPEVSIFRWKKTIREARKQAAKISSSKYEEVRFEELTTNPRAVLKDLCQFLGLDFEESMLLTQRDPKRIRGISNKTLTPNSGSFKKQYSSRKIARLENIAGSLLHELGYAVADQLGDKDLAAGYVSLRQTITHISRMRIILHDARHSKHPLRFIASRLRAGLDSIKSNRFGLDK